MTSSTNQYQSTPDVHGDEASSTDHTQYNLNLNGEVSQVTQLTDLKGTDKSKNQDPFIPPSDGTPVHNLPNELLSYIFTLGSKGERDDDDDDEEEEEEDATSEPGPHFPFQVLVSHVCQRWRVVAIETPTLWAVLDFSEGPPFEKSRTWLERSKECPLDIELDFTEPEPESDSEGSEDEADPASENELFVPQDAVAMMPGGGPPLLNNTPLRGKVNTKLSGHISPADLPVVRDLILPHSARWRAFEYMVDDFQMMYDILSVLASIPEAPELRDLGLYHHGGDDQLNAALFNKPYFAPFCGRAPGMREVALWGVHVDWEACTFLQGLEEFHLAYHAIDVRPPYDIFIRILRGSPDLRHLTLTASGPAGNPEVDFWPADVIELPSVRKLTLAFLQPSYASALMKRLVFPNLRVLTLDFDMDSGDYSPFITQLASPAPKQRYSVCQNLVELTLAGMYCSDEAMGKLFFALPNVLRLGLNCHHLDSRVFGFLSQDFRRQRRADV